MGFNPDRHHRHSIRLPEYNYARAGWYFITICTQERDYRFGEIVDTEMRLNDVGLMIERWWRKLPDKFTSVMIDAYVVMPNHFHGIVAIEDNDDRHAGEHTGSPLPNNEINDSHDVGADPRVCPPRNPDASNVRLTLSAVIQWFKTMTTNEYIRGVKQCGWPPFQGKLWQRNYYEHIIRNEEDLNHICHYIAENPLKWSLDEENPANRKRS